MAINDGIDLNTREETIQAGLLFYIVGNFYCLNLYVYTLFTYAFMRFSSLFTSIIHHYGQGISM